MLFPYYYTGDQLTRAGNITALEAEELGIEPEGVFSEKEIEDANQFARDLERLIGMEEGDIQVIFL